MDSLEGRKIHVLKLLSLSTFVFQGGVLLIIVFLNEVSPFAILKFNLRNAVFGSIFILIYWIYPFLVGAVSLVYVFLKPQLISHYDLRAGRLILVSIVNISAFIWSYILFLIVGLWGFHSWRLF
jgi:hypothetical protein